MHYDFLVEDVSGAKMLEILVAKILSPKKHSWTIKSYKGCGTIPKGMKSASEAKSRILLDQLPRLLEGYGKRNASAQMTDAVIVVVCDLDRRNLEKFLEELSAIQNQSPSKPNARFCLAIEEGEAWLLGDIAAVQKAYPKAKKQILNNYHNDSICGTWELLADALYKGGADKLKSLGYQAIGKEKTLWAENITPFMDIAKNKSPSFNSFVQVVKNP